MRNWCTTKQKSCSMVFALRMNILFSLYCSHSTDLSRQWDLVCWRRALLASNHWCAAFSLPQIFLLTGSTPDGYSREPGYQLFEGKHSDSPADVDKAAQQQLKFPPFHAAMLKEVWADASQNMGRIKIIISEGIYDGQPAPSYQRLRNIVAFSFQHAPLRECIMKDH